MKVLTFGEIMLRLKAPGHERFFQSPMLEATFGGGEANVAVSLANYGMEVIDSGVPVLNMHAPWEIISMVDLYEALRGYEVFLKEA